MLNVAQIHKQKHLKLQYLGPVWASKTIFQAQNVLKSAPLIRTWWRLESPWMFCTVYVHWGNRDKMKNTFASFNFAASSKAMESSRETQHLQQAIIIAINPSFVLLNIVLLEPQPSMSILSYHDKRDLLTYWKFRVNGSLHSNWHLSRNNQYTYQLLCFVMVGQNGHRRFWL